MGAVKKTSNYTDEGEKTVKMLIPFIILVLVVFTSCTSVLYQEAQQEGNRFIENYEDTPMRLDPEEMKREIKAQLTGKWQFVGIDIQNETVNAETAKPKSKNGETDASVQTPLPLEVPQHDTGDQVSEKDGVQLSPITVEAREDNQKIAAAKMALAAANRKNLVLEFYEERTSFYYRGSNRGRKVTGQCNVIAPRVGDVPLPLIRFRRRTGPKMLEFLFTSEPARLMSTRGKQAYAENMQRVEGKNFVNTSGKRGEKASPKSVSYRPISAIGIEVTNDQLYLILHGDMELTPEGWRRTGGLRCTFERIE
jgi:hypothetical protein